LMSLPNVDSGTRSQRVSYPNSPLLVLRWRVGATKLARSLISNLLVNGGLVTFNSAGQPPAPQF
jgi:hypothetical protein